MQKPLLFLLSGLLALSATAQSVKPLRQRAMSRWGISPAGYSGITALGNSRYALVSDNEKSDGFYVFRIEQDSLTGRVSDIRSEGFFANPSPAVNARGISVRDCEGVAYFPSRNTLFISGEGDQRIQEYGMDGRPTGRELAVPQLFSTDHILHNYGFEALCYSESDRLFWTTTESTLPADGYAAGRTHPGVSNVLRLQAFDERLQPAAQYAYRMDAGRSEKLGAAYIYGVSALSALPDGRLLVLEREANITAKKLGSTIRCKLFLVNPAESAQIDSSTRLQNLDTNSFMIKRLLADWTTHVRLFHVGFANYEGICPGRTLADGRRTLLLVSDSQGGYRKGPYRLKDFIKVLVIE